MKDILFPTFSFYPNLAMDLGLPTNFNGQYSKLTKWEKIFALNFYKQEGLQRPTDKETKYDQIRSDINAELERLYAIASDESYFSIDTENNPYLDRKYETDMKGFAMRGENDKANYYKTHPKEAKATIAKHIAELQKAEYEHLVYMMETTNFEPAFLVLMLRETLIMVYKKIEAENIFAQKREKHKTLAGHLVLNKAVLNVIYNKIDDFSRFSSIYFAALDMFNKSLEQEGIVQLDNIGTYNKGAWIRFESQLNDPENFFKNSSKLAALVQGTPWCTKDLASYHLEQGDFYVFVDRRKKPRIAIKMDGKEITEIRGIKGGSAQEIEDDFRDIVIEFLSKNKDIKNSDKWLRKEKWNQRLTEWDKKIATKTLQQNEVGLVLKDICFPEDYKPHNFENLTIISIKKNLSKMKHLIAKHFNLPQERICCGDLLFGAKNACNYVIIFGAVDFEHSQATDLGILQNIGGNANFSYSHITTLKNLQSIGGNVYFEGADTLDLGELRFVGKTANFKSSKLTSLGKLQAIGGEAIFNETQLADLGALQSIGGDAYFQRSTLTSLGQLEYIGGDAFFDDSNLEDFGALREIGGCVLFSDDEHGKWLREKFEKQFYYDEKLIKFIRRPEFVKQQTNPSPAKKCKQFE